MLSAAQQQQFEQQGYLVVEGVIDTTRLQALRAEYAELLNTQYQQWRRQGLLNGTPVVSTFWQQLAQCSHAGLDWFQPLDISLPFDNIRTDTPMHFGPAIFDIVTSPRVLDIVESLIGPEITSNPIQHVRIKPPPQQMAEGEIRPHINATDWHQDRGVGHEEADNTDIITVWVAITDVTVENGCLQVIPGVHEAMLPHCPKLQTAIADEYLDESQAVPLPVKAGGVVLFHPLTPHSSLPNVSKDSYRWSFDLRYNVTGQPTGRSHFPDFVARSRAEPESELRDWWEWKKLWEDTRIRVAKEPHIPQHRWTVDSPFCA